MRAAMLPGRDPEVTNSFRRYIDELLAPRDPTRQYGSILPISSDPNVPGSGQFDLRGGFTGDLLGLVGAGSRAMRGEAYDPMDITTGLMSAALPNAMRRPRMPNAETGINVYHGSPHNYSAERLVRMPDGTTQYIVGAPDRLPDLPAGASLVRDYPQGRFRMSQIGTGEGNQAYGSGLYMAEAEKVGRSYRDTLAPFRPDDIKNVRAAISDREATLSRLLEDHAQVKAQVQSGGLLPGALRNIEGDLARARADLTIQQNRLAQMEGSTGRMYEARIRANPERFLDWDAVGTPAFKEPPALAKLVDNEITRLQNNPGELRTLLGLPPRVNADPTQPWARKAITENLLRQPETATALREAGIPGIRYWDGTSRAKEAGTRNYVVFDENLIEMIRKYGIAGLTMGGISMADPGANSSD
jgi:hypothetical protein